MNHIGLYGGFIANYEEAVQVVRKCTQSESRFRTLAEVLKAQHEHMFDDLHQLHCIYCCFRAWWPTTAQLGPNTPLKVLSGFSWIVCFKYININWRLVSDCFHSSSVQTFGQSNQDHTRSESKTVSLTFICCLILLLLLLPSLISNCVWISLLQRFSSILHLCCQIL